jgi:hypothetical protein
MIANETIDAAAQAGGRACTLVLRGEFDMKINALSGSALAAAAISLALAGAATTTPAFAKGKVHCSGINSCKGKSECKTAKNECKGLNTCKGEGYVSVKSEKACTKKGGTVI